MPNMAGFPGMDPSAMFSNFNMGMMPGMNMGATGDMANMMNAQGQIQGMGNVGTPNSSASQGPNKPTPSQPAAAATPPSGPSGFRGTARGRGMVRGVGGFRGRGTGVGE